MPPADIVNVRRPAGIFAPFSLKAFSEPLMSNELPGVDDLALPLNCWRACVVNNTSRGLRPLADPELGARGDFPRIDLLPDVGVLGLIPPMF